MKLKFFFFERAIFIGPTAIFLEHWALPNGNTSLDPQLQNKTNELPQQPTFSVYIHESWTLGKPYGIKLRCYWERIREQLGNLGTSREHNVGIKARCYWEHHWGTHWKPREHIGNLMGTHWELEGNMLGTKEKKKISSPPPKPKT
jgi:hypothetical protein